MAAESKSAMTPAEMKRLLTMATADKPINCAVGVKGDGPPILLLHRMTKPRALEAEMKKDNPDVKVVRWGTAVVDTGNPSQINLSLNKLASGLGKRLVKVLKGTGFNKVHLVGKDEDGNDVVESHGDEEIEAASPATAAPDAAAAPEHKDPRSAKTVENAKQAWVLTLQKLDGEIEKLLAAMSKAYEGHGFAKEIDKVVRAKVEPVLAKFDRELIARLDAVIDAKERDEQTKAVQAAHKKIQEYQSFLDNEPMLAKLDTSPFGSLNLVKLASGTLKVLDKAVGAML